MLPVGVVIPVYNRPALVLEAIENVWAQRALPAQLVVVNDGSTDATATEIERLLASRTPPCPTRLIHKPNGGGASANNRGAAELAGCELLAIHDSDDLWPDDYLARMTAASEANPTAVAASCDRVILDLGTGERTPRSTAFAQGEACATFFREAAPIPSLTVMRLAAFRAAAGYDERLRCPYDQDLHLRLSLRGPWVYVPGAPVTIRRAAQAEHGAENLTSDIHSMDQRISYVWLRDRFIFEKGHGTDLPARIWRPVLAGRWHRLGQHLRRAGRSAEAAWCYRRSVEIAPWRAKSWFWRWATRTAEPPRPPGSAAAEPIAPARLARAPHARPAG